MERFITINIRDRILKKQILRLIRTKGVTEQLDKEIFGNTTQALIQSSRESDLMDKV